MKLVGHIVERLMPIGTEEDPEDADEDSASRVGFALQFDLTAFDSLFFFMI